MNRPTKHERPCALHGCTTFMPQLPTLTPTAAPAVHAHDVPLLGIRNYTNFPKILTPHFYETFQLPKITNVKLYLPVSFFGWKFTIRMYNHFHTPIRIFFIVFKMNVRIIPTNLKSCIWRIHWTVFYVLQPFILNAKFAGVMPPCIFGCLSFAVIKTMKAVVIFHN